MEFEIEDLAAGGARVLEEAVFLVGNRVHVGKDGTEGTLTAVGFGVLGTREPAEEVRGTVVEFVGNEMMTNVRGSLFYHSYFRLVRTFAVESQCHEDVASVSAFSKAWIRTTSRMSIA